MLTLKDCRYLLWSKYTAWSRRIMPNLATAVNSEAEIPQLKADAYINMGWGFIAEDLKLINILATGPIVKDEPLYALTHSYGMFTTEKVVLQKAGKEVATLDPQNGTPLSIDSNQVTSSSIISACSFGLVKHDNNQAELELRLFPAPDWDDDEGIWIFGHAHPQVVSGDSTAAPYHMDGLNLAGVDFAMFLVTGDTRLLEVYQLMVKPWRKAAQGKETSYMKYPNAVALTHDARFRRGEG